MDRQILRKIGFGILIALLGLALLASGWQAYLQHLNRTHDTACQETNLLAPSSDPELLALLDTHSGESAGLGLQASVVLADGSVLSAASGDADREQGCPMTSAHLLFTGSVTKLYVAATVMSQIERGNLDLDAPIEQWLTLPAAKGVTLRQLLNHTSGIPDYSEDLRFRLVNRMLPWKSWTGEELQHIMRRQSLSFTPGTRYAYSNSNYILLVEVLERVSGRPFDLLLQESFLDTAGLQNTYFDFTPTGRPVANGYDRSLFRVAPFDDVSNVTGLRPSLSSNVVANAKDVALFTHGLFSGQLLAPASLEAMMSFGPAANDPLAAQVGYGLGIAKVIFDQHEFAGHTGVVPGYSAMAVHSTKEGHTTVILSNLSPADLDTLAVKIADLATKRQKQ